MARLARLEVFSPDEIAIVHVVSRVVRRCFLFGTDELTGKNYDQRKLWIETELKRLAAAFGIDLLAFSILSNHFHLILRSRPDVVATWDDTEVARRWLMLCPIRKDERGKAAEPTEFELNSIRHDEDKLKLIRNRLSDISWWMRLLCQTIAQRCNREDQEVGKFFQSRYRAVRLLDETALLACAAYVDLNPIRAAMAETLETSQHTSVQRRIEALQADMSPQTQISVQSPAAASPEATMSAAVMPTESQTLEQPVASARANACLSPIEMDELNDELGPRPSSNGCRASDKGFLAMPTAKYIELLDWTARQVVPGKRGSTPSATPSIFQRLKIEPETWCELVSNFGRLFSVVAGRPAIVEATRSRLRKRRHHLRHRTRELLAS